MKDLTFYGELINEIDNLTHNYNRTVISARFSLDKTPMKIAELNLIEQMVLRYIYLYGPFSMSTLSNLTNLKPSYLSRVTGGLEKSGFCEKTQSMDDQRVYYIGLTSKNFSIIKEHVENLRRAFLQRFFSMLERQDIELFRENLLLIIDYLILLLQKLGVYSDIYPENINDYDLFELMDKRSKCANKLILFFGSEKKLPFSNENLNYYQNNIIFHLHKSDAMSISALARLTGFNLKHLSGTLKGLVKRGMITKSQCPFDGRVHYVALSKSGKQMANDQDLLEKVCYKETLGTHLGENELKNFLNAHKTLNQIFQKVE